MRLQKFRLIRPDTSVFLYYAGRDRKYMALSRVEQRVFLDIPGFVANSNTFANDNTIIQALRRTDDASRYLRDRTANARPKPVSEYPDSIPYVENKLDRSFVADLGNIKIMFQDLMIGDLIVMTPFNHYDPLLIGEVASDWSETQIMTLPDHGEFALPYREVTWLSHGLGRRDFPADVARRMQNRKAITKVDPLYYEPIFKRVYHSYIWGNTSKVDVFAPLYNSNDPTATAESSFLIKYGIALYSAFEKGELEEFNALSLEDAAEQYFDPELALQVAQSFGSPGGYITKVLGVGAVAVSIVLATALSDESQPVPNVQHQVAAQTEQLGREMNIGTPDSMTELGNSLRAGTAKQLREKYGRPAKAKLGLTLHGEKSPEVTVTDRISQ